MLDFLVTFAVTIAGLPLVFALVRWRNVVDMPNERSSHARPIYRAGGLACLAGALAGFETEHLRNPSSVLWASVAVVVVLAIVGLIDDIGSLPPLPRLVVQLIAGGVAGWQIGNTLGWLVTGVVIFATLVNVVNFMDGIDGITGLTTVVWAATAAIVAGVHHDERLMCIAAIAAGAAAGFLPANLPRARLFLGDVGSYLFGGLIALGIMIAWRSNEPMIAIVAPVSVYLVDVGYTLIRRTIRQEPLMSAHRDHVYQRLVRDCGLNHPTVAVYAAGTAAIVSGLWLIQLPGVLASLSTICLLLIYLSSPVLTNRLIQRRASNRRLQ